jgi:hypothetical protein
MEVRRIAVCESGRHPGTVRLQAEVVYDDSHPSEVYWFEVPEAHAAELSGSGDPWLASLLPLAATLGEPLRIRGSVDEMLLENAVRVMNIWRAWYPHLAVVPLHADGVAQEPGPLPARTAAFFSGGVDSFFTVLRPRQHAGPAERGEIGDLITVWGFDIKLESPDAFSRLRQRHVGVARALGKELVEVATNLRSTRWAAAQWSYLAHGSALAGVALALGRRFRRVHIASGGGYRGLHPWGSHLITDPLLSTTGTTLVHDGSAYLRTEKTVAIAHSPVAMEALRVCYHTWSEENCGVCSKCLRTMLTLELVGALQRCTTLPHALTPAQVERMDCSHFADLREFEDIRRLAVAAGRVEMIRALERSLRRGGLRARVREGAEAVRGTLRGAVPHLLRGRAS